MRMKLSSALAIVFLFVGCVPPSSQKVSALLTCHAVGDVGMIGQAAAYDLRYSVVPVTDSTWERCTKVKLTQRPKNSGELDTFVVSGLVTGATYNFAVKVISTKGVVSQISNIATKHL